MTASLYPRRGIVGERSWFYGTALTRKREARHEARKRDLFSDAGIDLDGGDGAQKLYASLVEDQALKVPTTSQPFLIFLIREHSADPALTHNNPTPEQAFLVKNYDKNARREDRNRRGIVRTSTNVSAPPVAGLVGPLGSSSFSLPMVERALAEIEGSSTGATLRGLRHVGVPTSSSLRIAPNLAQHEDLLNIFKSALNPKDGAASPGTSAVGRRIGRMGVQN